MIKTWTQLGILKGRWPETHIKAGCGMDRHANIKLRTNTYLNPVKNLWTVHKDQVSARKLPNLIQVYQLCQENCLHIQPEF